MVTRGLLLGVLAATLGAVVSATPAAALTCAPGDIVVVKEKATPTTVPSGSEVSHERGGVTAVDAPTGTTTNTTLADVRRAGWC